MAKEIEYVDPGDLVIIGLDSDDREEHPLFDERAFWPLDENLMRNILVYGVLEPVRVRKEAGRRLVVDGRQRVKAAREAKTRQTQAGEFQVKVPTFETKGDDKRVSGIMISLNEQRQNDDILTKALKAARRFDITGDDIEMVAIDFGRTPGTIKNWLSLAAADPKIHGAMKENPPKISSSAAIELSKLPREEQVKELNKLLKAGGGEKVTEAKTKKARQKAAGSNASEASQAAAAPAPEPDATEPVKKRADGRKHSVQQGIKRTWLRKALGTKAAEGLGDEHRKVLRWFAFGENSDADWFNDFVAKAEKELSD
jgi:ParB-like chromosome segregation protein Spo0J